MPLPADADLVRRDPAIIGMALLLDDAALSRWAADLDADIRCVRTTYLRYKPGTSLIAGLVLETAAGPAFGFATAYAEKCAAKAAKARRHADRVGSGLLGRDTTSGIVLGSAQVDRQLPGITRLLHRQKLRPDILTGSALTPLRYKPQRRWVARAGEPAAETAVVKVHRPGTLRGPARAHSWLQAAGAPIPALLLVDDAHGLMASRWVPGRALQRSDSDPGSAHAAGHALARLHATPVGERLPSAPALAKRLCTAATAIAVLAPALSEEAADVIARIRSGVLAGAPQTPVHGDFSPDQVVISSQGPVIVDLDRAHVGDPAGDLAGYIAASVTAGPAGSTVRPALIDGYRAAGGRDVGRALAPLTAAAVLGLVDEPFRLREPDWPRRMAELVSLAGQILDRP